MSWKYDTSKERVQKHADGIGEIEIKKLARESDLDSLLSETKCREIYGAHVYVDVSNFAKMASEDASDENRYKRLIQATHIYQREVARIVEDENKFDGLRVHFQGAKLHALFYRPIDDSEKIAAKTFLLQAVIRDFIENVFNPSFEFYEDFEAAGGADIGDAIGTRNGSRSDRELLFLGAPANYAAKIINESGQFRVTKELYDALPEKLQDYCSKINDAIYQIKTVSQESLDDLLEEYGIDWDREASEERVKDDKKRFPLKDIEYSSTGVLIDIDSLGITKNKRVLASSIFGGIVGNRGEKWFERDAGDARLARDRRLIARHHPNLQFALNFALGRAVLRGTIVLREENSGISTPLKVKIIFPNNYPDAEPFAFDGGNGFPYKADRHFYKSGLCCLWLPLESQWQVKDENTLLNFVDQMAIFFERQLMYNACGYWAWGERGHGEAGFIEYFEEYLGVDFKTFEVFLPVLSNETIIHNKTKCPCGSNRNYDSCHKQKVEHIRNSIKNMVSV